MSKKVLITGGTGFLGKALQTRFHGSEYETVAVGTADGDLRKRAEIEKLLSKTKPEIVIHLAANVGGIGKNLEQPAELFYDNAVMGIELIDAAFRAGIRKLVCLGTVCAYPKISPIPFQEENLWDGYPEETNAPYGIAKKILLVQSQAYRKQYNFNSIYLLPVNLYGPHDNFDLQTSHVIPALIRKFYEAKINNHSSVTLWGDGSATREFLYINDAANAIYLATKHYDGEEAVNIGTGDEISIRDLATKISELVGFEGEIKWDTSMPNGQPRRKLETSKAKQYFGYEATTKITEGLKQTVDWYIQSGLKQLKKTA